MQCSPVLRSLIPAQGVWNGKSQPGQRVGVPAGRPHAAPGTTTDHPWKRAIRVSQEYGETSNSSEVVVKTPFLFPPVRQGG